ncbi:three-helix bundle dimerization domain-containing protein [Actinoplanes sp. URMC 104]|uniref:three-helix bundle dimerization domain-containing protein n=1 Tax=Actinoplanes sp. URMC 104 TaxID=3423409 RepID=UPI003F1DD7F6
MTEPAAPDGVDNPQLALQRVLETLGQRFPDVDRTELEERVHATYNRLAAEATVDSHLVAVTEKQVTEDLRRTGETVHVRSEAEPSDSADL